ncbi:hypothetical protein [Pontibacter liquoris]|uniref:hypothetical protein n=1 Tax=Pontibacter liquoris TaxID=2905677 RepID=UPI001FA7A295|nr:hypothetical protein [Pontibacter liquoris]
MKKLLLWIALPLTLLAGCQSGPTEEEQKAQLEESVMQVHDAAMAKMSEMYHLRNGLRALRDSLETQKADTAVLQQLQHHVLLLNKADEAMMGWMHQYHAPDSMATQQAMEYLTSQQEKIKKVSTTMDSTLAAARQIYTSYEKK